MRLKYAILIAAAALILALPGGALYYHYETGAACARCHEIRASYDDWHASTHRSVACGECHGGPLASNNLRRVWAHFGGRETEQIRLTHRDLYPVAERCKKCHQQEYAQWQSGPHAATYKTIFLDAKYNAAHKLMDDCLRCHGMHFAGSIKDLVAPVDLKGPWKLLAPELSERPAIPCLGCHEIHRHGNPLARAKEPLKQELIRPSVSLFDRREERHFSVKLLALPQILEGGRVVKMSRDARQALCYQCHAPLATAQAFSGDDRTALGVHEGISCLACHQKHSQQTRQSCSTCHPRMSNCGIDVETMDTTFKDVNSRHNIHTVKCADCHPEGVPQRRNAMRSLAE